MLASRAANSKALEFAADLRESPRTSEHNQYQPVDVSKQLIVKSDCKGTTVHLWLLLHVRRVKRVDLNFFAAALARPQLLSVTSATRQLTLLRGAPCTECCYR